MPCLPTLHHLWGGLNKPLLMINEIKPVAVFHSPLKSKFGLPRQSGVADRLVGYVELVEQYNDPDMIRGIEDFEYLWLIWGFSANRHESVSPLVRPPRLGGNSKVGVFASRSPFRPNGLGLSVVRLQTVETGHGRVRLEVTGADLMDGTPIYDIKPYLPYTDSHPDAKAGFTDTREWQPLNVEIPPSVERLFEEEQLVALRQVLSQDPRPHYHDNPDRVYGFPYYDYDVRFRVCDDIVTVVEAIRRK